MINILIFSIFIFYNAAAYAECLTKADFQASGQVIPEKQDVAPALFKNLPLMLGVEKFGVTAALRLHGGGSNPLVLDTNVSVVFSNSVKNRSQVREICFDEKTKTVAIKLTNGSAFSAKYNDNSIVYSGSAGSATLTKINSPSAYKAIADKVVAPTR